MQKQIKNREEIKHVTNYINVPIKIKYYCLSNFSFTRLCPQSTASKNIVSYKII